MAIKAEVLDALLAAGATAEMIVAAVKADAAEDQRKLERKRAIDAARQRRHRGSRDVTRTRRDPPIEEIIPPVSPSLAKAKYAPPAEQKIVSAWNAVARPDGLKPSQALNADRRAKLKRRLAEFGEEKLVAGIGRLSRSRFHCGDNDRGWRADLGWFVRSAENVTKALELDETPARPPAKQTAEVSFLDHKIQQRRQREEWAARQTAQAP